MPGYRDLRSVAWRSRDRPQPFSLRLVVQRRVDVFFDGDGRVEAVLKDVRVFAGVVVVAADDLHGAEAGFLVEELRRQVRLADFQRDRRAAMTGKFADELLDHLRADALAAVRMMDGE